MITYGTPEWHQLEGRFAVPQSLEAAHAVRIDANEVIPLVETLQEIKYCIKVALDRIGPTLAQSVDGAQAERFLQDGLMLLDHLTKNRA